jgi:hypothetical protein
MVDDETKLVARFGDGVYGDNIHSGQQFGEWFGESLRSDFLLTLLKEEIPYSFVLRGTLWFTVGSRIAILLFGPRPKSFREPNNYRLHECLVGVILKELIEFIDIYVASYFK